MPHAGGSSSTWSSSRTLESARLVRLQNLATHIGVYHSPYFPKQIGEFVSHQQAVQGEKLEVERQRILDRLQQLKVKDTQGRPLKAGVFLGGKALALPRLDAEAQNGEKIWPFGPAAQIIQEGGGWPCMAEYKMEGEYRVKQGLGRWLPPPRQKMDGREAGRLVNDGIPVEVVVELMATRKEDLPELYRSVLEYYGQDEMTRRARWYVNLGESGEEGYEDEQEKDEEEAAGDSEVFAHTYDCKGGLAFDEDSLRELGDWAAILSEID